MYGGAKGGSNLIAASDEPEAAAETTRNGGMEGSGFGGRTIPVQRPSFLMVAFFIMISTYENALRRQS